AGAAPALEVRGLIRRFGGLIAVSEVDLVIPPRGIVGLIGPNGAGKTTFFNLVTGLLRPDRGEILVDRSEEHTSELPSHRDLHSFPTRRSSDLRGIVGLIGPNGAGKTTFFNLVTGLLRPDRGEILVD